MIALSWQDLAPEAAAALVADVNAVAPYQLPVGSTKVRVASLPFYTSHQFYSLADTGLPSPNERFVLYKPGDLHVLNWTNEPIYRLNEVAPVQLDRKTVVPYAKFFFHFVRGQLGRFNIVEKLEEVAWTADATAEEKEKLAAQLLPVTYKGMRDNLFTLTATVVFKNALFRTDIKIAPADMDAVDEESGQPERMTIGQLKLTNEELLLEDLHVVIDPPPGEFG